MADNEEFTVEGIRISELPVTSKVDKDADYIPLAHTDTISVSGNITYKVTPAQLLSDVGLSYEAGDHIDITGNVISATYDAATVAAAGLMSSTDKSKLDGIESGANNYTLPVATTETLGGVKAGNNVVIENDGTLNAQQQIYTAGTNVDITNNVISATDTTYDPATTSTAGLMSSSDKAKLDGIESGANYYVLPAASANAIGGVKQGQNVTIAADGTLDATNTTYSPATTSVDGLMSSTDKTKLDGIEAGANNYSLPIASSAVLGGVKQGNNITIDPDGTINATGGGGGSSALASLTDVNLSSPTTGQALIYDGTSAKWVNGNGGGGSATLAGLTDVTVTSATNGQVLTYDSNSSEWINAAPVGASSVSSLTDVTLTSLTDGQILKYDNATSKWVNSNETIPATPALGNLTNVTLTSPTDGQALIYDNNSSEWVNGAVAYSSISGTPTLAQVATSGAYSDLSGTPTIPDGLADLTNDVNISSPADGQILKYDGTSSKWVNGTGGGGGASALDDLTDVDITTPTDGQTLVYDSTNSKWINGAGGGGGSAKQTAVTQAQYNALVQAGTVDPTMEYFITDGIPYSVAPWTDITATLTTGQTSLVFSNAVITTNSTIDIYVDDSFYGVNPLTVTLATGSLTLVFPEQDSDMPVKVRVS